jgi:hypothetical protein
MKVIKTRVEVLIRIFPDHTPAGGLRASDAFAASAGRGKIPGMVKWKRSVLRRVWLYGTWIALCGGPLLILLYADEFGGTPQARIVMVGWEAVVFAVSVFIALVFCVSRQTQRIPEVNPATPAPDTPPESN